MTEFIFMLTHSDRTVPNARAVYDEIRALRSALRRVQGHRPADRRATRRSRRPIRADGREVMLEVVSERRTTSCARSARRWRSVSIGCSAAPTPTRPSRSSRHEAVRDTARSPDASSVIRACSAARSTRSPRTPTALTLGTGVHGLDLLAYRYDGDVEALAGAVNERATWTRDRRRQRRFARTDRDPGADRRLGVHDRRGDLRWQASRVRRRSRPRSRRCSRRPATSRQRRPVEPSRTARSGPTDTGRGRWPARHRRRAGPERAGDPLGSRSTKPAIVDAKGSAGVGRSRSHASAVAAPPAADPRRNHASSGRGR